MSFLGWVIDLVALTPAQEQEYHAMCVEYGYIDPTPAEQARMDLEETENYVENMRGQDNWITKWFTGDNDMGYILHWEETCFDQKGVEHVLDSGSHYVGYIYDWNLPSYDLDVVAQGEVVEEYVPVYMRLQR